MAREASGGSASAELFESGSSQRRRPHLETLVREICQNSIDQRVGNKKAKVFFDLILLTGKKREKFLESIDWSNFLPHLSSVSGTGGAALTLKAGIDALKSETLVCLRISDSGTRGLTGDDWDEEKPDITSYGSNITSAQHAASLPIPGTPAPLADASYIEQSGTSMATPIASGVIALLLEASPGLSPEEVKDIIRQTSEPRGEPADDSVSRWNETYGYGIIDASCAVAFAKGQICDNGLRASTSDVNVSFPVNGTWVMSDSITRISGDVNTTEVAYDRVEIKIVQNFI